MIWLIGNRGMLGTQVSLALEGAGLPYRGTDREVDILDPAALETFAKSATENADDGLAWIVNCAAYTAVDRAEDEEELAHQLNAVGPENLGKVAASLGARVLHISTDYVFSGTGTAPYREDAPVGPNTAYGRTKAEGERRLMAAAPNSVIIRTAWLYGKHGPNFVYTMLRLMAEKESIGVVADQRGTPTYAPDLADAILHILRSPSVPAGIYHFTDAGETDWHEFALEIQRLGLAKGILERSCAVKALTTNQYPTKAKRPAYSVLHKGKIADLGVPVPNWRESLATFIEELKDR